MGPQLIVMLTHNDMTVPDAEQIFEECRGTRAAWFGFKEKPLLREDMARLCARMKACGKKTALEVVAYTEAEGLAGARLAAECGFDLLMGTMFFEKIAGFCREANLAYFPFVGKVTGRPSVLEGGIDGMVQEARGCLARGAAGIDLLGYRYTGDADLLIRRMAAEAGGPVCIAGSVNSLERLSLIREAGAQFFTIGSAFFAGCFGGSVAEQIDRVCAFMEDGKMEGRA